MPDLTNSILENVLSYIQSAKSAIPRDQILLNALAYYKPELIMKAKEIIYKLVDEVPPKRKKCIAHPNPSSADLEDILSIFERQEGGKLTLPSFVAFGYASMPPSAGFESFASVMCSFRDEVAALRLQVEGVKKASEMDLKALENVGSIIQDVSELKMLVHDIPSKVEVIYSQSSSNVIPNQNIESDVIFPPDQITPNPSTTSKAQTKTTGLPSYANALRVNNTDSAVVKNTNSSSQPNDVWHTVTNGRRRRSRSFHNSNSRSASQLRRGDPPNNNVNKNRRIGTRRNNISGKRSSDAGLQTAPRILDVFLCGCGLNTTETNIMEYCKKYDVPPIKCDSLESKSDHHKCYKISVSAEYRDKLLDAEFWPRGIFVGKFYKPKLSNLSA